MFSELSSLVCAQIDFGDTRSSGDASSSTDSSLVGLWWNTVPGAISWISFCLLRRRAYRCHARPAKMAVMARVTATAIAAVAPLERPEDVLLMASSLWSVSLAQPALENERRLPSERANIGAAVESRLQRENNPHHLLPSRCHHNLASSHSFHFIP